MALRIDTDRFVVCGTCSETEHFGNVTIARARELASDWQTVDGVPFCPDCQDRKAREEN